MSSVNPMADRPKRDPHPSPLAYKPPQADKEEEAEVLRTLHDLVEGEGGFSIHASDEAIEGLAEGVDPRLLKTLRSGTYAVQEHLDLHGLNREEARAEVDRFLLDAVLKGNRCVLVIHGRGQGSKDKIPVLKNALKTWFTRRGTRKLILAFCTARPCDGGGGAVYVLLRKKKPMV